MGLLQFAHGTFNGDGALGDVDFDAGGDGERDFSDARHDLFSRQPGRNAGAKRWVS